MRYAGGDETGPKSWWDCGNTACDLRWHEIRLEQLNSRPELLRIKELEENVKELERKLQSAENEIEDRKPYLGSGKMTGWSL